MRRRWLFPVACLAMVATAAIAGAFHWSTTQARRSGQLDGICIALDMVMAHGLMDQPRREMVTAALATPVNPYFDRIGLKRAEMARHCQQVADERWHWK